MSICSFNIFFSKWLYSTVRNSQSLYRCSEKPTEWKIFCATEVLQQLKFCQPFWGYHFDFNWYSAHILCVFTTASHNVTSKLHIPELIFMKIFYSLMTDSIISY